MSEKLLAKNPIYPLIGILSSILIIVFGLITANNISCLFYLCGMWFLFLIYGYWRSCFAVLPVSIVMCGIFAIITYVISGNTQATFASINRILAVCIAVIPGLAMSPIWLIRNFSTLKIPRMLTLGMMITLTFFPLLGLEIRQVREAMKTRGAGSLLSPKILYRAFLIPLIMRLVNISDTLSLSVETRGFTNNVNDCTVYKVVKIRVTDVIFLFVALVASILVVIL